MATRSRSHQRGASTASTMVAIALLAVAARAAASALGWLPALFSIEPMPAWGIAAIAALVATGLFWPRRERDARGIPANDPIQQGDFSDPGRIAAGRGNPYGRKAPAASETVVPAGADENEQGYLESPEPATRPLRARSAFDVALLVSACAGIIALFHWIGFRHWERAPVEPFSDGMDGQSYIRILALCLDFLLLPFLASRFASPTLAASAPLALRKLAPVAIVAAVVLEGSGALRDAWQRSANAVAALTGQAPPYAAYPETQEARSARENRQARSRGAIILEAPPAAPVAPVAPRQVRDCAQAVTLQLAAASACTAQLTSLLAAQPEKLESRDMHGLTPLAAAVLHDQAAAAETLLKAGANANARVRQAPGMSRGQGGLAKAQTAELADDSTPLMLAKRAAMADLLLRQGADPLLKNDYGWSAIFYFTRNGNPAMLDTLIRGGANIDDTADVDPSHAGSTPLMWAAYLNLLPQLDALLDRKPRLDIRDRHGFTALDYATRLGHKDAAARLKAAAAN